MVVVVGDKKGYEMAQPTGGWREDEVSDWDLTPRSDLAEVDDIVEVTRVDKSLVNVKVSFVNYLGYTGYVVDKETGEVTDELIVAYCDNIEAPPVPQ